MSNVHQEQTEDNEPRFLIESPVPCSGINSNYTARHRAPNVNLEFMQSFQKISIVHGKGNITTIGMIQIVGILKDFLLITLISLIKIRTQMFRHNCTLLIIMK